MARIYADENFPVRTVKLLRDLSHDVLTAKEAGKAGIGMTDEEVLTFANSSNRAVLTLDRSEFMNLHNIQPIHCGIILCMPDLDRERLARRINEAMFWVATLNGQLIRVSNRSFES